MVDPADVTQVSGPGAMDGESISPGDVDTALALIDKMGQDIDADGYDISNPGNLATLTAGGVVFPSQIPDLAITETYVVADKSGRLALSAQEGDVAVQQDTSESYIFVGGDPSNDADWSQLLFPEAPISTVFGRTGDVKAKDSDYDIGQIGNVDVSAILEGADSEKPAAGSGGRWFWATDTETLYRDNGTTWEAKAGRGTSSDPVPGTMYREAIATDELNNADFTTATDGQVLTKTATGDEAAFEAAAGGIDNISNTSPGFDSWTQIDANKTSMIFANVRAETDGSNKARIRLMVDQSGGTTPDTTMNIARAPSSLSPGHQIWGPGSLGLEAGAQYQINNLEDPNVSNTIIAVHEVTFVQWQFTGIRTARQLTQTRK